MGHTLNCYGDVQAPAFGRARRARDRLRALPRRLPREAAVRRRLRAVSARDGVLTLKSAEGTLTLALGATAPRSGRRPSSRRRAGLAKIGVKPASASRSTGVQDPAFVDELKAAGADVSDRLRKASDAVFVAVESRRDLKKIARAGASLAPDGALWAIRRKGVAEASEALTMAAGKAAGLVDVKVVRFSETHTAEKFVIPKSRR